MPGKKRLTEAERRSLAVLAGKWLEQTGGEQASAAELRVMLGEGSGDDARRYETRIGFVLSAAVRLRAVIEGRRIVKGRDAHTRKRWYRLDDADAVGLEERKAALLEERRREAAFRLAPAAVPVGVLAELRSCKVEADGARRRVVYDVTIPGRCERLRIETAIPVEAFDSEHEIARSGSRLTKRPGAVSLAERILRKLAAEAVASAVLAVPSAERPEPTKSPAEPFGHDG
jgi:hypothetical protein